MARTKGALGKKNKKQVSLSEESKKLIDRGLQEAKEGKIERIDLEKLAENMNYQLKQNAVLNKEQEDRRAELKEVMKDINKEFKDPNMCKFAIDEPAKESLSFGMKELDEFLGGGAVYGNYVIFWGSEGVGKTTLALMQIAEAQRQGKNCVYLDLEHTLDKERMKLFGVNLEDLILIENTDTAEQAMDIVIRLSKEKVADLIIVDSIQAMSVKEENVEGKGEKNRSMEESEIAALAKKMGKFLRRTCSAIYKGNTAIILIGQARTGGIGTFATHEELTGGRASKFFSMLTVQMRKGQGTDAPTIKIKDEEGKTKDKKIGFSCVLIINKTKKCASKPELSELRLPYYFASGFIKKE